VISSPLTLRTLARAGARRTFGAAAQAWVAQPSTARAASITASEIVG
jgi:hypothetical protein